MKPLASGPLKLNSMGAVNGVGVVLAVLLGIILAIPKTKDAGPGFSDVQHLFYYVIPLPLLLILAYKRTLIDPAERRIRITKGIWPVVVQREIPYEDSAEILLDAMQLRAGRSYSAQLSLPSQKKPILILADGDEVQLQAVVDFARGAGFPLHAKKGMQKLAPDWVRAVVPDLHRS